MTLYHGSNMSFRTIDLRRMQFRELYTQYSFHTERALSALRFKEVCDVA